MYYVLTEIDPIGKDYILGVFDHAEITESELADYYGNPVELETFRKIEDSGMEWEAIIRHADGWSHLLMLSYSLNEIG